MKRPAVVYYPAAATPLTPADLRASFATQHLSDPVPRALYQILSERLAAATIASTAPRLSARPGSAPAVSRRLPASRLNSPGILRPPQTFVSI